MSAWKADALPLGHTRLLSENNFAPLSKHGKLYHTAEENAKGISFH
jgi:hypothetical protein